MFIETLTILVPTFNACLLLLKVDHMAVGDNFRASVDRAMHLSGRCAVHHHLRRDPAQDARSQRGAAQDLYQFCLRLACSGH